MDRVTVKEEYLLIQMSGINFFLGLTFILLFCHLGCGSSNSKEILDGAPMLSAAENEIDQHLFDLGISPISAGFGGTSHGRICISDIEYQNFFSLSLSENILKKSAFVVSSTSECKVRSSWPSDSIANSLTALLEIASEGRDEEPISLFIDSDPINVAILCEVAMVGEPYVAKLFFMKDMGSNEMRIEFDEIFSPLGKSYIKSLESLNLILPE